MKKLLFLLLIFSFVACNKNSDIQTLRYKGQLTQIRNSYEGATLLKTQIDTINNFELVLDDGAFRRFLIGKEGCDGNYEITKNELIARTEDCDCMCGCIPEIDCPGDYILGNFDIIEMTNEKLRLHRFFENEYIENFSISIETVIELEGV